ncbi:hypothetical protein BURPS1106B_A0602 [Burkholderia pseudomallei 1106b]|uniref:Uncharacterized protein n=1 Tax=Burkholderia pseudomallei (strain 1106a) TaxID=357348 RepID=A3NTF6_BURP0|nr:hypothetical protein BURPS1106A_1354 [Burkholderia pseudomallei 1106a]EBA44881.1 hypothetical protein BURPS305_0421 [Burkholderia pseudomallei 305]EES26190.1 hypothetical protein BURPS1106B_A0602 [Burkholderia pseudomallei 1106b]
MFKFSMSRKSHERRCLALIHVNRILLCIDSRLAERAQISCFLEFSRLPGKRNVARRAARYFVFFLMRQGVTRVDRARVGGVATRETHRPRPRARPRS